MQRRSFLRTASVLAATGTLSAHALLAPPLQVRRVLVVFKCHLDVGFTQTQALVMQQYFQVFFPAAIETAAQLRSAGDDRYTWTTGSWLLYEYLEQASPAQRHAAEAAIAAGDLAWHALPFSWQTEMLDRSMIEGALGFSAALDQRFGCKTTGAKMSDVPGHTRGIIAPLQAAGVCLLDIGVNAASTPPQVPEAFLWRDPAGNSVVMLYHLHDYGGVIQIPGSDLAIAVEMRNDNTGPHSASQVAAIYTRLRREFPGAVVRAASLSQVANAVEPYRSHLPVITQEIGDTWIYGVASDPTKVARFREMSRLRREWISQKQFKAGDATDRQLLRRLALTAEHTWGTDTKTYLDNEHYRPADLASVLDRPGYVTMQTSWREKREDLNLGVASLPQTLREQAHRRLAGLGNKGPARLETTPFAPQSVLQTRHFTVSIDPITGAIVSLKKRATGKDLASPNNPIALFTYQTLSAADFADFLNRYVESKEEWAPRDFGKPGIDAFHAQSQEWHPALIASQQSRTTTGVGLHLDLRMQDDRAAASGNTAWPAEIALDLRFPDADSVVEIQLSTSGKQANRLPEAMWLTFHPALAAKSYLLLEKSGQNVDSRDVIRGGARAMHAVTGPVRFTEPESSRTALTLTSLDAPVVAIGARSPLNFSLEQPSLDEGIHICLYNNAWGTNYPQWCSGEWTYRFTLSA